MTTTHRNSKYEIAYCEIIEKLMKDGALINECASELGVTPETLMRWRRKHPEFDEAFSIGRTHAQAWYEKTARMELRNPKFNTILWSILMRNSFGYTEHRRVELPELATASSYLDQCGAVKRALINGDISAEEALKLSKAVAEWAKVEETTQLKSIIEKLEAGQQLSDHEKLTIKEN